MFLSDFADFFIQTGLEGESDRLLADPATPCLLRPEGHPSGELANVFVVETRQKWCSTMSYELYAPLRGHRPCSLVIIFVACE